MITFAPGYYGWLGNQMFQYAAVFSLAKKLRTEAGFPQNKPNLFDIFNLTASKDGTAPFLLEEKGFHYTPLPTTNKDLMLRGYFQSEKYFKDYEEELRKEFTFKSKVDEVAPQTTSIHVRRGDYVTLPNHHPLCTLEYYKKAISMFSDQKFLVFSDDLDWCRDNIKGASVSYSDGLSPEEDLHRMTMCDNHIIANSSFSWWGAWLSNGEGKVIAPKQWFGPKGPGSSKDLIPNEWILL